MNDFESKLRQSLTHNAERAPAPTPFEGETMRRVRVRRSTQAFVAAMAIIVVATGVVFAARVAGDPPPEPPANNEATPAPEGRLLYLLDPKNLGSSSEVVSVDPETGERVQAFRAGYDPQMTFSPSGDRLYIVSSLMPEGVESYRSVIDTFDTSTGRRLARATLPSVDGTTRDRTLHKLPPYTSDFVASSDGSRIYFGLAERGPSPRFPLIATFDTRANELLPNTVVLPVCTDMILLPGAEADELTVVCTNTHPLQTPTNFAYVVRVGDDGSSPEQGSLEQDRIDLPDAEGPGILAGAVSTADHETVYAVTRGGHVYVIDVDSERLVEEADLRIVGRGTVQMGKVLLATSGRELYVGTGIGPSDVEATRIISFVAGSWVPIGWGETRWPYWSLALGPGEDYLYAPTFREPRWRIQKFDARTFQQWEGIRGAGETPSLVQVPRLGL